MEEQESATIDQHNKAIPTISLITPLRSSLGKPINCMAGLKPCKAQLEAF